MPGIETHLVHMHTVSQQSSPDSTLTTMEGAPETCRMDRALESENLEVKQEVDIWSMGCVYSEVTTWVGHGWNKVDEYRRRRRVEFKEKTNTDGECFHDGDNTLLTVEQIHTETLSNRRVSDHVTPSVLEDLVQDMMIVNGARLSAKFVFEKSKRIINKAKAKVYETPHPAIDGGRPQMPPNLPPGFEDIGTRNSSPYTGETAHDRATQSNEFSPNGRPFGPTSQHENFHVRGHQMNDQSGDYREPPVTPTRPGRVSTAPQQSIGQVQQNRHTFTTPNGFQVEPLYNNRFDPIVEDYSAIVDLHQPLPRRETRNLPLQDSPGFSGPAANVSSQNPASNGLPVQSHPHNGLVASATDPLRTDSDQRRLPVLSVKKGLQWKTDRQYGKKDKLDNEDLFEVLKGRDHVSCSRV